MRWVACSIVGLVFLFIVLAIADKLSAPPGTPPLAKATTTPIPAAAAPPVPPPKPLTPEERERQEIDGLKQTAANLRLSDQVARTKTWADGSYLRLDQVEIEAAGVVTRWTLFVPDSGSDLFYVNVRQSTLLAGPASFPAQKSDFPDLAKEDRKQLTKGNYLTKERLQAHARFRVARGRETNYTLRFASPAAIPDRMEAKISAIRPADAEWESLLQSSPLRGKPEDLGAIASVTWDGKRHAEIALREDEIEKREKAAKPPEAATAEAKQ